MQKHPNLRMTRQRRVILEELRKVNNHPSAYEIYEFVRKRLPRISLGTVYRNLEILSESGDIQKLEPGCSLKRFDGNYHPILNELDQLEREGEIECQVINGKVFFKKKEKTKRKYILRKGRNFRKYIG